MALPETKQTLEAESLAALYDRVSPNVRAVLRKMLASNEEAEAVLERAFLALSRKTAAEGEEGCAAGARLLLAIRLEAANRIRSASRLAPLSDFSAGMQSAARMVSTEEMASLDSRRHLLRRLIAQLPDAQRKLLELVVFGGQTEEEIAAHSGEPLGKVRDQVRAAFAFTRQRVQTVMGAWTAGL